MDYMSLAIEEAKLALKENEVPVGCVIVYQDKVIAKAHNLREKHKRITSHAEILAINQANDYLGTWHLDECILYTTLEPCMMCTGAMIQSRIKKVIIGTTSNWPGLTKLITCYTYNHQLEVEVINNEECSHILTDYFKSKRL